MADERSIDAIIRQMSRYFSREEIAKVVDLNNEEIQKTLRSLEEERKDAIHQKRTQEKHNDIDIRKIIEDGAQQIVSNPYNATSVRDNLSLDAQNSEKGKPSYFGSVSQTEQEKIILLHRVARITHVILSMGNAGKTDQDLYNEIKLLTVPKYEKARQEYLKYASSRQKKAFNKQQQFAFDNINLLNKNNQK